MIRRTPGDPTTFLPETTTRAPRIPPFQVPPGQLALATAPADPGLFPVTLWFAALLREGAVFLDPDWAALRQAAPPGDPLQVLPSARNTPWLALDLQERDPVRFAFWVDHVRTALPQVTAIAAVEREEDHYAYLRATYAGGYEVTSSGLSEGTLRILALTLLPYLPYLPASALPALLVTEEPENGIYPCAIETVVQSLASITGTQVWVSTHSPIVLADTPLDDVLAARLDSEVFGQAHELLRSYLTSHARAVAMLDNAWDGSPGTDAIKERVSRRLAETWDESAVIVIDPELEAWVWQDNPNVPAALGAPDGFRRLLDVAGHWPAGQPKLPDPKEALEYLRARHDAEL